jgi:flagellar hook assembly protein FlgD
VSTPTIRGIHPNPFSHATSIAYALPKGTTVRIEVLDASGRRVRTVVNGEVGPGEQTATWDGKNDAGKAMAAGVYFAQLRADGTTRKARLVLLANDR